MGRRQQKAATELPGRGKESQSNAAGMASAKNHLPLGVKEILSTHPHWVTQLRILQTDTIHADLYLVCRAIFRWVINEVQINWLNRAYWPMRNKAVQLKWAKSHSPQLPVCQGVPQDLGATIKPVSGSMKEFPVSTHSTTLHASNSP